MKLEDRSNNNAPVDKGQGRKEGGIMFTETYYLENKEKIKEYQRKYHKKYYEINRDKILKREKERYLRNRETIKLNYLKYHDKNKGKISKRNKIYYQNNREYYQEYYKEKRKEMRKYYQRKYKTDLKYNLRQRMSQLIRLSLKTNKNGKHWEDLVGYTMLDLKTHLHKTMPENYTWQDYMEGNLHIDHIIPISAFDFDSPENLDFKRCWSLKNLQLLPAKENMEKSNKIIKEMIK